MVIIENDEYFLKNKNIIWLEDEHQVTAIPNTVFVLLYYRLNNNTGCVKVTFHKKENPLVQWNENSCN